jgi:arsenite-transporting ATPase
MAKKRKGNKPLETSPEKWFWDDPNEPQVLSPLATPKVLFFSGKGGVGKTTLAGTAAQWLAQGGDDVLVASTDPAHSLSDLFDQSIGAEAVTVSPGVAALEIDAPAVVDRLFSSLGSLGESAGMTAAADILRLASQSPGVDEIVSLDLLLRLIEQPRYGAVVLDTAPTGHTLRLLSLPGLMDRYFGRLLRLRGQLGRLSRRFRKVFGGAQGVGDEEFDDQLAGAQGRMQMLGELLRDPARCSLFLVTIPEAMSVLETSRTFELLQSQGMSVTAVAVNMLQPAQEGCAFCSGRRDAQLRQLDRLHSLVDGVPLVVVEHQPEEPRGPAALQGLAQLVWSGRDVLLPGQGTTARPRPS